MIFTRVSMTNFGPVQGSVSYSFDDDTTIIIGDNGCGKSTIFDAIEWSLFGVSAPVRGTKDTTSVINQFAHTASVTLEATREDGDTLRIVRTLNRDKKHTLSVSLNGADPTRLIGEGNELISQFLGGVDASTYRGVFRIVSSTVAPQSFFLSATPAERRLMLSRIADPLGEHARLYKKARDDRRDIRADIRASQARITALQEVFNARVRPLAPPTPVDTLVSRLDDVANRMADLGDGEGSTDSRRRMLERQLEENKEVVSSLVEQRDEWEAQRVHADRLWNKASRELSSASERKNELAAAQTLNENAWHAYVAKRDRIRAKFESAVQAREEFAVKEKAYKQLLSLWDSHAGDNDGNCMLCNSHIGDRAEDVRQHLRDEIAAQQKAAVARDVQVIEPLTVELKSLEDYRDSRDIVDPEVMAEEIDALEETCRELYAQVNDYESQMDTFVKRRDDIVERIARVRNVIEDTRSRLSDSTDSDYRSLSREHDALVAEIARARAVIASQEEFDSEQESLANDIAAEQQRLEELEATLAKVEEEIAYHSPEGAISTDINALADRVSDIATTVYRDVLGGKREISLVTQDDDEGNPVCEIVSGGRVIQTYSHGEQSLMIIPLVAALAQASSEKIGVWFPPMWDEPETAIDGEPIDDIIACLDTVSADSAHYQSFVITRHPDVLTYDDMTIIRAGM